MNFTAKSKKQQGTSQTPHNLQLRRGMGLGLFRLALLLVVLGSILRNSFLLAIGFGISGVLLVAWGWDAVSLNGLHYTRYFYSEEVGATTEMRAFLGETVELKLEVYNRKLLPVSWLEVTDRAPTSLAIEGGQVLVNPVTKLGELHTFWRVGAFQRQARHYTVHCNQRGYHLYGPVTLTTGDGFGFFERTARLNGGQRLIVYPKVYSAAELRLPAVQPFGERLEQHSLFEDPLRTAGIREWSPADGMRRVHWKATAKNQRMLSRLYEPSREPQVLICLNVATLVHYWEGLVPELLERAVSVAASLAVMCAGLRLPVGLLANAYWPGSDQPLR
ncbi:MAG: DUF58 domain-containing protein, partial [Anaerolineae bacterium]|nr:DUF58 domain-containing protein [Anaerolineae bacterium]